MVDIHRTGVANYGTVLWMIISTTHMRMRVIALPHPAVRIVNGIPYGQVRLASDDGKHVLLLAVRLPKISVR
jgi:hypothetical protein